MGLEFIKRYVKITYRYFGTWRHSEGGAFNGSHLPTINRRKAHQKDLAIAHYLVGKKKNRKARKCLEAN